MHWGDLRVLSRYHSLPANINRKTKNLFDYLDKKLGEHSLDDLVLFDTKNLDNAPSADILLADTAIIVDNLHTRYYNEPESNYLFERVYAAFVHIKTANETKHHPDYKVPALTPMGYALLGITSEGNRIPLFLTESLLDGVAEFEVYKLDDMLPRRAEKYIDCFYSISKKAKSAS